MSKEQQDPPPDAMPEIDRIVADIAAAERQEAVLAVTSALSSLLAEAGQANLVRYGKAHIETRIAEAVLGNQRFADCVAAICHTRADYANARHDPGRDEAEFQQFPDPEIASYVNACLVLAFLPFAALRRMNSEGQLFVLRNTVTEHFEELRITYRIPTPIHMILQWTFESLKHRERTRAMAFPERGNIDFYARNVTLARYMALSVFLSVQHSYRLAGFFKTNAQRLQTGQGISMNGALDRLRQQMEHLDRQTASLVDDAREQDLETELQDFMGLFRSRNEECVDFVMRLVSADAIPFLLAPERTPEYFAASDAFIDQKIAGAAADIAALRAFAHRHFRAFNADIQQWQRFEWTNKVYLIANKFLASLEAVQGAIDAQWQRSLYLREFYIWIDEMHGVLNKFEIEDDWQDVADFLVEENQRVEWKGSFYTPIQNPRRNQPLPGPSEMFALVGESIISMANTDGGTILVGHVERADEEIRPEAMPYLRQAHGKTFFDVQSELDGPGRDLDMVKRTMREFIARYSGTRLEKIPNVFEIQPIEIKAAQEPVRIFRIDVAPAPQPIFKTEADGDRVRVSLQKRSGSRKVWVDPRESLGTAEA